MTRYSRSVIPGRAAEEGAALDRMVFGAKGKSSQRAANDDPDFLPPVNDDEADMLVARSNADRRRSTDRRGTPDDRRKAQGRRASEYTPLRADARVPPEDGKRGPILLVGALLIVAVFGFVVWNAYRDGLQTDTAEATPELSTSGTFKTPPREVVDQPVAGVPIEQAEALDGAPGPAHVFDEKRPVILTPKPVEAAVAPAAVVPAPSKVMATPPAQLKTPPAAQPVKAVEAPKPAPVQTVAAAPPPSPKFPPAPTPVAEGGYRPAFQGQGDHVVQIAATGSETAAELEWGKLQKANPDLLTGGQKFIVAADVGGKTVYRVRVGSFASKADASAFCTAFKARGGNCFPAVK